jgi:hypothetical protein
MVMGQFGKLLVYYLRLAFKRDGGKAELGWDWDNEAEIEDAIYDFKREVIEETIDEITRKYELKLKDEY